MNVLKDHMSVPTATLDALKAMRDHCDALDSDLDAMRDNCDALENDIEKLLRRLFDEDITQSMELMRLYGKFYDQNQADPGLSFVDFINANNDISERLMEPSSMGWTELQTFIHDLNDFLSIRLEQLQTNSDTSRILQAAKDRIKALSASKNPADAMMAFGDRYGLLFGQNGETFADEMLAKLRALFTQHNVVAIEMKRRAEWWASDNMLIERFKQHTCQKRNLKTSKGSLLQRIGGLLKKSVSLRAPTVANELFFLSVPKNSKFWDLLRTRFRKCLQEAETLDTAAARHDHMVKTLEADLTTLKMRFNKACSENISQFDAMIEKNDRYQQKINDLKLMVDNAMLAAAATKN